MSMIYGKKFKEKVLDIINSELVERAVRGHRAESEREQAIRDESQKLVANHQAAVRAALRDVVKGVDDDADPVVTFMAVTITRDGKYQTFSHGAVEPTTGSYALHLLDADVKGYLLGKLAAYQKSPLLTMAPNFCPGPSSEMKKTEGH